jgi:hypothetical protein
MRAEQGSSGGVEMKSETWGGVRAAAELSGNCARIELESSRSIPGNGGKLQSPGKRIARVLRWNCAAAALLLAACQTPAVHDRVVPISVPIAVQPIKPSDVPVLPAPLPKRPADARQALDLALAQVCAFVAYGLKADPLLRVSAGLPPLEPQRYPECER